MNEVARLLDNLDANSMRALAEGNGGTWEPQGEAASSSTAAVAVAVAAAAQASEPVAPAGN